jgi:hypothetical protein
VVHPKLWVMNPQHEEDNYHIHDHCFQGHFLYLELKVGDGSKVVLALCFIHMFDLQMFFFKVKMVS